MSNEIVLPETQPETEWVRGRALQKVSPTYSHARLQLLVGMMLETWNDSGCFGRVGTEWRFRVTPRGGITRPLVPDVAYLSYAKLAPDAPPELVQVPLLAPTVAIEIRSPDDRDVDIEDKIETYLRAGTELVVVVEPVTQTVVLQDAAERTVLRAGDVLRHPALPSFELDLGDLFRRAAH